MKGTIFSVTLAIDLMPPRMTMPTARAKAMPMAHVRPVLPSLPVTARIWAVAWLAWNMLPPPSEPRMQNTAKAAASTLPRPLSPRSARPSRR